MLSLFWKLVPKDYKWSVGIKKAGQMVGKAVAGLIVGTTVGKRLPPEHVQAVEFVTGALTMAGLEWVHDWARMKWPNAKWL